MTKAVKALFVLLFLALTVSGSLAAEKKNDSQIMTVDRYVAIFDFEVTTGDKGISRPLADRVIHVFSGSDKYEVIDRGNMNKILGEQKFQMSGCVAQECKVEAGQILGVGKIVNGSVGLVGKTYYLTLQLIDVKTGKVDLSAEDVCRCEVDELLDSTKRLAKKLLGEKVEEPAAIVDVTRPPDTKQLTAPAAIIPPSAPAKETARDGRFIAYDNGTVLDTRTNLMWAAKDNGYELNWKDARSYCENYRGGGYSDWRLPTQDELVGLYDETKTYNSGCILFGGNVHLTELIRVSCFAPWASESRGSGTYNAIFGLGSGKRGWDYPYVLHPHRALPVRSAK
jgi:TolB-like protein